jgi:hypothetical protein
MPKKRQWGWPHDTENLAHASLARLSQARRPSANPSAPSDGPDADDFARGLSELVGRGVSACFVYWGSGLERYSYPAQFADRFRGTVRIDAVDVQFLPAIDHTLTTLDGQATLLRQFSDWCVAVKRRATMPPTDELRSGRVCR